MGIKKKIEAGGRVPADGQANTNVAANHNEQGYFFSGNLLIFHKMKYFIWKCFEFKCSAVIYSP